MCFPVTINISIVNINWFYVVIERYILWLLSSYGLIWLWQYAVHFLLWFVVLGIIYLICFVWRGKRERGWKRTGESFYCYFNRILEYIYIYWDLICQFWILIHYCRHCSIIIENSCLRTLLLFSKFRQNFFFLLR